MEISAWVGRSPVGTSKFCFEGASDSLILERQTGNIIGVLFATNQIFYNKKDRALPVHSSRHSTILVCNKKHLQHGKDFCHEPGSGSFNSENGFKRQLKS
jgi:hypothetical protein